MKILQTILRALFGALAGFWRLPWNLQLYFVFVALYAIGVFCF